VTESGLSLAPSDHDAVNIDNSAVRQTVFDAAVLVFRRTRFAAPARLQGQWRGDFRRRFAFRKEIAR
jgi:hypothetical protein